MRVSTWIDCGWKAIDDHRAAHVRTLRECGISRVCLMLNQPNERQWAHKAWPSDKVWLQEEGIALTLTTWARPNREYLDAMAAELPELADRMGADIELDLEGQWTEAAARRAGWTLAEAEQYLLGCLRPKPTGPRLCLTSAYVRPQIRFGLHCDEVALQCYSHHDPEDPALAWDAWAGPAHYPARGAVMFRDELARVPSQVIGLAAWAQEFPGHEPREAMQSAWATAERCGVEEIRYWSWTWIAGLDGASRGYAYQFLKQQQEDGNG